MSEPTSELFRDEAAQHYQQAHRSEGAPLRASPVWLAAASYVLFAVALSTVLALALVRLPSFVSASGVIRASKAGSCEPWAAVVAANAITLEAGALGELEVPEGARARLLGIDPGPWSALALQRRLGSAMGGLSPTETYALGEGRGGGRVLSGPSGRTAGRRALLAG